MDTGRDRDRERDRETTKTNEPRASKPNKGSKLEKFGHNSWEVSQELHLVIQSRTEPQEQKGHPRWLSQKCQAASRFKVLQQEAHAAKG